MKITALLFAVFTASAVAQGTRGFSLRSRSKHTHLNGRFIAELQSTDSGKATPIILDHKGNSTRKIGGFLQQGSFLVDQPLRNGGSEYDGWIVGPTNPLTLTAVPEVQPAGSSEGWYFRRSAAGNATLLGYQNDSNRTASFLACHQDVPGERYLVQQLVLGFSRRVPAACHKIDLAVIFQ